MKKLLFLVALIAGTTSFAQNANIGLLGGSTVTGWTSDTDMVTTDGVVYTLNNVVITVPESDSGVKFRLDDAWATSWGGGSFPSGTASSPGQNIPAINGTYNVMFNLSTLQYSFTSTSFDVLTTTGIAALNLQTVDGVNYFYNNYTFEANGGLKFAAAAGGNWGGAGFPLGTATAGGQDIPVQAGTYNIKFNKQTLAYSFDFVTVSIIGAGAIDWDTDIALTTTDGDIYTLNSVTLVGGEIKFRVNNNFDQSWGGTTFPSGTGDSAPGGPNLMVTAGTYSVTFNRSTGEYSFDEPTASTGKFAVNAVTAYPNPTQNNWNFTAATAINNVAIVDATGKEVLSANYNTQDVTVNASGLAAGIYFARVSANNTVQVIKVVKK